MNPKIQVSIKINSIRVIIIIKVPMIKINSMKININLIK
jgi:hypothetical protein